MYGLEIIFMIVCGYAERSHGCFRGHGFSLLTHKVHSLRALQTRAVPTGVTDRIGAELVKLT